jgi:glyoxylase-like metal-dependent hydrolase (beta-lactamase superfamily II)
VRVLDEEVPHARGERIEQIREVDIARQLWRPKTARWVFDIVRAGGPKPTRLTDVVAFRADGPLDVPGRPVPVPTPGHTTGHCAFHLPERGVLIAGDALMTDHLWARSPGPQLLPPPFNADDARARASLDALEPLDARVVIPGHGPAFAGTPADAVRAARGHPR